MVERKAETHRTMAKTIERVLTKNELEGAGITVHAGLRARRPKKVARRSAAGTTFALGTVLAAVFAFGLPGAYASGAVRAGSGGSERLSSSAAARDLKALHRAEPYKPVGLQCDAQSVPEGVITALNRTQVRGLHVLAEILRVCNSTHSMVQALSAAGGLSNPEVQGLNAFGPIDYAIQQGEDVSTGQIDTTVHAKDLAALLLFEMRAEDP